MTLLSPSRLWLFVILAALAAAYAVLARRKRQRAVRHPDLDLLASVAPRGGAWRRHLTAAALFLSVAGMVLGLARPAHAAEVPRDDAVVVLAIDTSESMAATDVSPSRIEVAVAAAKDFVDQAPSAYRIGLVTFDASAQVAVSPTTDHAALTSALDAIELHQGTAAGDAVTASLDAIEASSSDQVVLADDQPYRAIVLLSDGASTSGASIDAAAAKAADAEVPVFTVAYGTADGVLPFRGTEVPVPSDPSAMAALADATDGETYTATSARGLADVYDRIGTRIGTVTEQVELTVPLAAGATVLLAAAFVMSLAWAPRLV
ncbi:VWA domain-containing protein [Aquihabitans sp. G128]|uniref:VWA domain-containing protein n=1 Tax=Aquihabitans sp. G128 TaxID=2849779 RepID=UPI001C214475|nr:VWA domain-containing protein [Aquihabitans sp. G128]QXC61097.1 VWA domain-containing protein [Aquihabitans sp. G128]